MASKNAPCARPVPMTRSLTPPATASIIDIARSVLNTEFAGGAHLMVVADQFYRFVGDHWAVVSPHEVGGVVLRHLHAAAGDGKLNRRSTVREIVDLLKMFQSTGDDIFEEGEALPLLNLRNGQLVIGSDGSPDLQRHDPASGQRHCLDVSYDPGAVCPLYDQALEEIFSKAASPTDLIAFWHEVTGYILQPSRPDARIFVGWGDGSDGKTALAALVARMLGKEQVAAMPISKLVSNQFMVGHLRGKRLLLDDDVNVGTVLPDGMLKTISEAKIVTGELKHRDGFEFTIRAVPMLLCNLPPIIRDTHPGFRRRLTVIRFDRRFSPAEANPVLFDRIYATERAGVLNRMLQGLQAVVARGWKLSPPAEVEQATDEFYHQATRFSSPNITRRASNVSSDINSMSSVFDRIDVKNFIYDVDIANKYGCRVGQKFLELQINAPVGTQRVSVKIGNDIRIRFRMK
ncbi:phage/plasmid primase, P4 family [Methylobacterium sp. NEAU K]|uniref:DNA primase family protein n=1 Tax=Methylobacterium sp. NEAU K TaxID=3064946 RepID=UPI002736748D|nr:phage/plasmid primase, P4 family [Methylobacterium sp. NEAU K]MDP4006686.1 phage/plasmid primase, P4 family [Methylobacterium sp. NEAU K]